MQIILIALKINRQHFAGKRIVGELNRIGE